MTAESDAAALVQLAKLQADLTRLQGQVTSNWIKIQHRLHEVTAQLEASGSATAELTEALTLLRGDMDALRGQLGGEDGGDAAEGYSPIPAPRWWLLTDEERAEAIGRLASWVATVYVPGYGTLAERLPSCWAEHPLCLFALDWLSEMHSVLYLQPERGAGLLAAQAEWQTRLLPAAVDQMAEECAACGHPVRRELNGARP